MKKRGGLVLCVLAAACLIALGIFVKAEAVNYTSNGNPDDTATGTAITADKTLCTLDYTDINGNSKPQVTPATDITVTVISEYGISGIGAPLDQSTAPNAAVYYTYVVTNEGNASDTINLSQSTSYGGGGSSWTVKIVQQGSDTEITTINLAEDAEAAFRIKVTPAADATYGQSATVTTTAETASTPVGQYTGANGQNYGGAALENDATITTITGPALSLTRTSTVDSPTGHAAHSGATAHDPVPGAVITYTYTYSNTGNASADSNVIVDKIPPTYTQACHVNSTGGSVSNVTLTAAQSTAVGWSVFTSEAGTPSRAYGTYTGWTLIGTIDSTADYATASAGAGKFFGGINTGTTFIKFEKAEVASGESKTLQWGVTIK
jgi:uncharacterized repeat protein (TIGR01451 family)